jgi:DNA modification methylase
MAAMSTENTVVSITPNALFHANCVDLLERVEDVSIDLDPPLPSQHFNQTAAVGDTAFEESLKTVSRVCQQAFRVLKPTGARFFHTQPSYGFSVRLILNQVFGEPQFRNEIVWQYRARRQREHDVIVHYSKSSMSTNNAVFRPLSGSEKSQFTKADSRGRFRLSDLTASISRASLQFHWAGVTPAKGRSWRFNLETLQKLEDDGRIYRDGPHRMPKLKVFLDESEGVDVGTVWNDISQLSGTSTENLRYPTQKPLGLLERLVFATISPTAILCTSRGEKAQTPPSEVSSKTTASEQAAAGEHQQPIGLALATRFLVGHSLHFHFTRLPAAIHTQALYLARVSRRRDHFAPDASFGDTAQLHGFH